MKELLMGNEAIALGALMAGVNFVSGYPEHRQRKFWKQLQSAEQMTLMLNGLLMKRMHLKSPPVPHTAEREQW